ncbi:MAG: hypothetical protein A3G34_13280 [Candidatus Lindowbacteria bacterium RIFCSPLOWO2_12_FULL_62_27]|nr:MAG: hypothetical protein A3I06_04660 [Candidatus Lindowbacteria bacterium RIFCSPLOWO2_02_FULL_62_12]OGH62556.1 MAG: hypothetical protein A3G34_13280 [Candidatus Lindowbacteria bacterium RIFCSPLOWO2_12_FULL_62_27]
MNDLFEKLLDETERRARRIEAVRGPAPGSEGALNDPLDAITALRGRPLFYPFIGSGAGRGALVELLDGSVKWDFITGIGTNFFGHADRQILRTCLNAALSDIPIQGHLEPNAEYAEFLSAVSRIAPGRCKLVWPSMSGTLANENALKIIRAKKRPAFRVLAFDGAFAGRSTTLSEITDSELNKQGQADLGQALRIPFHDPRDPRSAERTLEAMDRHFEKFPGEICAIHVELVQGEAGFRPAPADFFSAVFDRCRRENVAVWVDEIQTFGRTGEYFMLDRLGLAERADVVTIGKLLCGSAACFAPEFNPPAGLISGTYAGYTAGLALGCLVIRRLSEEGHLGEKGKTRALERAVTEKMETWKENGLITDYTALGAMAALTPRRSDLDSIRALVRRLFDLGLCAYYAGHGPYRLRMLLPGGCLTPSDLAAPFDILERGLAPA